MPNQVIESWRENASEWIRVIDLEKIPSRKYTNDAILQVLKETTGRRVLDIGCGEGWLTRNITGIGKQGVGLDAIDELLENARQRGPQSFYKMSYEEIMDGNAIPGAPYDIAVFNFCLYQEKGLPTLFEFTKKALSTAGNIIVQTIHPYFLLDKGLNYQSQVIGDAWNGLDGNFTDGHFWFARTFEDWFSVFSECNMKIIDLREIINGNGEPISMIVKAGR